MLAYLDFEQWSKIHHFEILLLVFSVALKDPKLLVLLYAEFSLVM